MDGKRFKRLWYQKLLRNISSAKYQWLLLIYIPIIVGIFSGKWIGGHWVSKISAETGLGFLGGGFTILALGRLYIRTRLMGGDEDEDWSEEESKIENNQKDQDTK